MNNVLIYSNTITTRYLTYELEYVLGIPINKIFLMKENHSSTEIFHKSSNLKIEIRNDLDECIKQSDKIIITQDVKSHGIIPQDKCIYVNTPWDGLKKASTHILTSKSKICTKKPTIVIVSIGDFTNHYCVEIAINKVLSQNKIRYSQFFSYETKYVFSRLLDEKNNLIKHSEIKSPDVLVLTFTNVKHNNQLYDIVNRFLPDVLLICIDKSFYFMDNIIGFSKHIYPINMIIESEYVSYQISEGKYNPIYCDIEPSKNCNHIFDSSFEKKLTSTIFEGISLPKDVYIV